jgi:transcriptional regulator with XRE-family HTH domain
MVMEDVVAEVGNRIKALRKAQRIERKEAAKALGLEYECLAKYERGIREPDMATLKRIAEYFNVSLDYLYGRPESPGFVDRFPPDLRDWILSPANREFLVACKEAWNDGATPELIIAYAELLRKAKESKKDS